MEPLRLREMTRDDLPAMEALCAGRNVHPREYERFLALEGATGLVLHEDATPGTLLGAITCIRYFEHGFLGPVVLSKGHTDAVSFTIALLAHAIEGLQKGGVLLIEAEAADEEAVVLGRMGFQEVRETVVWERGAGALDGSGATRVMRDADLLDVGAIDADAAGFGRKGYLATLLAEHPEGARVVERDGEIDGYALVRRSRRGYHVGPVVTRRDRADDAAALVRDAAASVPSWPLVALAPAASASVLEPLGFARVGMLTRMRAGPARGPPASAREWLLGGRVTG